MSSHIKDILSCFILISFIFLSNTSSADKIVRTDGVALITSTLNKELYRTRAIENALQNLTSKGLQTLNSFSIVENGQVLIDQVHLASTLGIQQYNVVKEEIKGKLYHVSLNVVLDDKHNMENNYQCRKANPPLVDLTLVLKKDYNKMPAWFMISDNFISQVIANHEFQPGLRKTNLDSREKVTDPSFYSLYEKADRAIEPDNHYKLHANVILEPKLNNSLLGKNLDIEVTVLSHIFRKKKKILEQKEVSNFTVIKKNFNGLVSPVTRKDWPSTKKNMANFILKTLEQQLAQLNCLEFFPTIQSKSGITYLDYGSFDGIKSTDMFLLKKTDAKKIYFRIESLGAYRTEIKIISKVEGSKEFLGSQVEVVSGL